MISLCLGLLFRADFHYIGSVCFWGAALRGKNLRYKICLILLVLFSVVACNKDKKSTKVQNAGQQLRSEALNLDGLQPRGVDINGDGKDDQISYFEGDVLRVLTRDINFDGVVDVVEYYDAGVLVREESDLDFDGNIDLVVHYKNGQLDYKEYGVDFLGTKHGRQIFNAAGQLIRSERDTNEDGVMDEVEHYNPGEKTPYKVERLKRCCGE